MAIKIYSDQTKQYYDSVEAANKAENELIVKREQEKALAERKAAELKAQKEKDVAERKTAADKVEAARKAMVAAQKAYHDELDNFIKKYKSYHFTSTSVKDIPTLFELFDKFWF